MKLARGSGVSFVGSAAGRLLWLLTQVIVARFLGVEVFGLFILGLVAIKLAEVIARFGLHTGAMFFVSINRVNSPNKVKGTLISAVGISLINGLLIGTLLHLSAETIANVVFHKPAVAVIIRKLVFAIPGAICYWV